jgi:hypothetical protein
MRKYFWAQPEDCETDFVGFLTAGYKKLSSKCQRAKAEEIDN